MKVKLTVKDNVETVAFLSMPKNYDQNKPYPLLVALHGHGGNAEAFHELWKTATDSMNVVLLTPQGEINLDKNIFFSWGNHTEEIVLSAIDMAGRHIHLNTKKIYLTGFSMGGSLSYQLGLKNPHIFNGIAPLCSHFRESLLPVDISVHRSMRIYIGYGEQDSYLSQAKRANALFLKNGNPIQFEIYKNTGHDIPEPEIEVLIRIIQFLLS